MEEIIKKDGAVWLVKYWDVYGRHKTLKYLGKEFVELEEENKDDKPKKKRKGND